MPHRDNARNLDGLEYTVIVVAFYGGQIINHILVACGKTNAETGHIIGLAQSGKFDTDVLCAFGGKKTRRLVAVKTGLAVGKIVDDRDFETFRKIHNRLEEALIDGHCRRVMRIVENQKLGLRIDSFTDHRNRIEEFLIVAQRYGYDACAGHSNGVIMYRKCRGRHDGGIAGT